MTEMGHKPRRRLGPGPVYVRSASDRVEVLCTAVKDAKVESRMSAVAWAMRQRSVSHPREPRLIWGSRGFETQRRRLTPAVRVAAGLLLRGSSLRNLTRPMMRGSHSALVFAPLVRRRKNHFGGTADLPPSRLSGPAPHRHRRARWLRLAGHDLCEPLRHMRHVGKMMGYDGRRRGRTAVWVILYGVQ
jgi:hypothetical protein